MKIKISSLRTKILIATLLPILLVLSVITFLSISSKNSTEKQLLLNRLDSYRTLLESGDLSFGTAQDKIKLESLLGEKVSIAEIYQPDYSVIYTTNPERTTGSEVDLNKIKKAFSGLLIVDSLNTGQQASLEYITPLIVNNNIIAVARLSLPYAESDARVREYAVYNIIWALAGMLICYILISIMLERVLLRNISKLKQGTVAIHGGDLNYQINLETQDELGELADSFNMMSGRLRTHTEELEQKVAVRTAELEKERGSLDKRVQERTTELEKLKTGLEQTIAERTKFLNEKLAELERMNKHMIGRELKMAELKAEIEKLKNSRK